ncbi:MAG: hypothetical protein KDE51_17550 [Anaerolineales bacterium]|nr:hypothetical protein [Anaerolineales bacterium]
MTPTGSELVAFLIAHGWKLNQYDEFATEEVIFWLDFGYQYYSQWEADQNENE